MKTKYVSITLAGAGFVLILITRLHQLIVNPRLTEAQALIYYLPFWIIAMVIMAGALIASKKYE